MARPKKDGNKGKKRNRRYPVQIPNAKGVNAYSLVLKSVIDHFGLKIADNPTTGTKKQTQTAKKAQKRPAKGSKGAGSIKIPADQDGTKYKSMPVPSGVTTTDLRTFLNSIKSNAPSFFITKHGDRVDLKAPASK